MYDESRLAVQVESVEYGEIEYQTVECDHCGDLKMAASAVEVVVGEVIGTWEAKKWSDHPHRGVASPDRKFTPDVAVWCAGCAEEKLGYRGPTGLEGEFKSGRSPASEEDGSSSSSSSSGATDRPSLYGRYSTSELLHALLILVLVALILLPLLMEAGV